MSAQHKGRRGRPWRRKREIFRKMCQRDNLPCAGCGGVIDYTLPWPDKDSFTADHIIPWSKLPPGDRRRDSISNLQPMHLSCNARKNDTMPTPSDPVAVSDPAPWEW